MDQIKTADKFLLTISEASEYFNIGEKTLRRLAEGSIGTMALYQGNRCLIVRHKAEEYFMNRLAIGGRDAHKD